MMEGDTEEVEDAMNTTGLDGAAVLAAYGLRGASSRLASMKRESELRLGSLDVRGATGLPEERFGFRVEIDHPLELVVVQFFYHDNPVGQEPHLGAVAVCDYDVPCHAIPHWSTAPANNEAALCQAQPFGQAIKNSTLVELDALPLWIDRVEWLGTEVAGANHPIRETYPGNPR